MRRLCAVYAHPDDESFSSGATLARYADEGVEVTLITATRGEAGETGTAPVQKQDLAAWRERELREAAEVLGIHEVRLLGFPDGGMPERSDDLREAIFDALREIQPHVVITEDVQGVTGHPDHIAVTRAVVRAVDDLGDRGPLKLYEHVVPRSPDLPDFLKATPEDYITTILDVEPWRDHMLRALKAHGSQVSEETLDRFQAFQAPFLDHYVCVRTRVPILIPEHDLFSGVTDRGRIGWRDDWTAGHPQMMSAEGRFDRFTERASKVLTLAQEEALRFNHNYIGTEHLLLGLVREGEGVAAKVLFNLGIELTKVRSAVEFIIGRGERQPMGQVGLTPRSKKVIDLAMDEARRVGHHYIGTEHLLLGLIREGEGIAAGVLESLDVRLDKVRSEVIKVLFSGVPDRGSLIEMGTEGRFDRFTERARRVLTLAQEEALRFKHNYMGTEHLLLGLVWEVEGVAAKVLSNLGIEPANVRSAVESAVGRGQGQVMGEIGLTPRAKKVLDLAVDEGQRLGHHYVGTEHLLLGLVREGEGVAAGVLRTLGLDLEKVRSEVIEVLRGSS